LLNNGNRVLQQNAIQAQLHWPRLETTSPLIFRSPPNRFTKRSGKLATNKGLFFSVSLTGATIACRNEHFRNEFPRQLDVASIRRVIGYSDVTKSVPGLQ